MNKKIFVSIVAVCALITLGAIYFFNIRDVNQYCDYKLNWDGCNGKIVKITGNNSDAGNGIMPVSYTHLTLPTIYSV